MQSLGVQKVEIESIRKSLQERLTRGTVTSTVRRAAHPLDVQGAVLTLLVRQLKLTSLPCAAHHQTKAAFQLNSPYAVFGVGFVRYSTYTKAHIRNTALSIEQHGGSHNI